jgi:cysteine synthase A
MIYTSVTETVGRTPLVELPRVGKAAGIRLLAKLESRNPAGSIKDRVGIALVDDAQRRGLLAPGATIVEPTSGNTGIALAFVAAARGYRCILTMPERVSQERVGMLRSLGAEVVFTPGSLMREALARAQEITRETPGAVMLQQFENPANPEVHRRTTAEEIWTDTGGKIDVFITGVGTGGTITGVGEVLKARRPEVQIVAVEPASAAVLSGCTPGHHYIPGIGAGFIPPVLNRKVIDEVVTVDEESAIRQQIRLGREEGLSVGISSGAVLAAALQLAARPEASGQTFVVMFADSGERYLNNPVFLEVQRRLEL